jgi:hypothetical protein
MLVGDVVMNVTPRVSIWSLRPSRKVHPLRSNYLSPPVNAYVSSLLTLMAPYLTGTLLQYLAWQQLRFLHYAKK